MELLFPVASSVLATTIVILGFYLYAQKHLVEAVWGEAGTGFEPMKGLWGKAFAGGFITGALVAATAAAATGNTIVGLASGSMAGLLAVSAYSDLETHKVPLALTRYMIAVAAAIALSSIGALAAGWARSEGTWAAGVPTPGINTFFIPVIRGEDILNWSLISLGVMVAFFFLFLKIKNDRLAMLSLFVGYLGLSSLVYGLVSFLTTLPTTEHLWQASMLLLLLTVMLVVTGAADLFLGHGIGGADTAILHAMAFAFAWWVSPYVLFVAFVVACALQLVLHATAKPLGIGEMRELKRSPFSLLWERRKAKKEGREVSTTYFTRAVPFVPMLGAGVIGAVLVHVGISG